ncbi:MAG: hypothetical protein GX486_07685 [Acetobacter sp.]|nr:hypothetical protein [Acetobacter sp.]
MIKKQCSSSEVLSRVKKLKSRVEEAGNQIRVAMSFFETWDATVSNKDLYSRLGRSYATGAFKIITFALYREVILGLIRLWDKDKNGTSIPEIARALRDSAVVDALISQIEAESLGQEILAFQNAPPECHIELKKRAEKKANEDGEQARSRMKRCLEIIERYEDGKHSKLCSQFRTLRNKRLAHHDLEQIPDDVLLYNKEDVKDFYKDMLDLVHELQLAVLERDWDVKGSVALYKRNANFFWKGVTGEQREERSAHI